jgi:hypothetical protein
MMLKMVEESNYGQTEAIIMASIKMDKNMEKEFIIGLMAQNMLVTGNKMKCMVKVNLFGLMVVSILELFKWV